MTVLQILRTVGTLAGFGALFLLCWVILRTVARRAYRRHRR